MKTNKKSIVRGTEIIETYEGNKLVSKIQRCPFSMWVKIEGVIEKEYFFCKNQDDKMELQYIDNAVNNGATKFVRTEYFDRHGKRVSVRYLETNNGRVRKTLKKNYEDAILTKLAGI